MTKHGFTLVELAIVLVIIGLLIGGILVAQTMINTSKFNAFIRQVSQFDAATNSFKAKFGNQLPGDTNLLTNPGDNNGYVYDINAACYVASGGFCFNGEQSNFWPHLSLAGFDPGHIYSNTVTGTFSSRGSTLNGPDSKLGDNASFIVSASADTLNSFVANNSYIVANYSAFDGVALGGTICAMAFDLTNGDCEILPAFAPPDAQAVDIKMDDGVYNQGEILGFYPSDVSLGNCYQGGALGGSTSDIQCAMIIRSTALSK